MHSSSRTQKSHLLIFISGRISSMVQRGWLGIHQFLYRAVIQILTWSAVREPFTLSLATIKTKTRLQTHLVLFNRPSHISVTSLTSNNIYNYYFWLWLQFCIWGHLIFADRCNYRLLILLFLIMQHFSYIMQSSSLLTVPFIIHISLWVLALHSSLPLGRPLQLFPQLWGFPCTPSLCGPRKALSSLFV